ncbi:PP2C family protein-serine/threonine phosphatase [Bacillus taeanensis]|uniref:Serine/threonine-protein phosphatase n=1 Tax=Bacillus taeanensis TaxID=273032 RepID=A0A366XRH5_9BACI|nr:protein phosphatase 2C domain-containing protein [Bacillus taeanensis]RBW68950.1 serine/threonine-protein phosphatase [Bacillus taeanensis]
MKMITALLSNQGGRKNNEDFADYCLTETGGCWVVADGLGGHKGGETASKTAAHTILSTFKKNPSLSNESLPNCINEAHHNLLKLQQNQHSPFSFRTTITILTIENEKARWGHIGDSRLYHFKNSIIQSQTKDHSLCQTLVNIGEINQEEIRFHEDRSRLLQALGMEKQLKPSIITDSVSLHNDDAFLLCTDGFWEYVTEKEMEHTLLKAKTPQQWLTFMQDILLPRVSKKHDNYTAIAIFIAERGEEHVGI